MDYLDSFGEWLRRRREALRLTRPELADCVGCSVSGLRKIETDERRPSRQLAELLAQCLHIPPEEQLLFLDVARGVRPVARLARPDPRPPAQPLTSPVGSRNISSSKPSTPPSWNLPSPATALVGREAELTTLTQLLGERDCRLLTLVGLGGIGKTRLAVEVACLVWERFVDGVFFVSLANTSSPEFMVAAIGQAVGLNFSGPAELRSQLANYLRNKQILLVLDNVEHLLDGVENITALLAGAPGIKMLVTSRERLQLSGEWVFEVQGLLVPTEEELEGRRHYSSLQLFLQRARQTRIAFELSAENYHHVARICRLVEGMPLAIELAAAWVRVLSAREIADEIERGLDVMTSSMRDVPERQRSLRAAFQHSWKLLADDERRALAQLSVFQGGFEREAAEAVAGASLRLLAALVAKSFLRHTTAGSYSLHELVRQFAAERLAESPEEVVQTRDRHSTYYTDLVARLGDELKGERQLQALVALDGEVDNIRAGWRWAVRRGELATIHRPLRALWYFYEMHAWYQEAEAAFGWAAIELGKALGLDGEPEKDTGGVQEYLCALQGWFYLRRGKLEKSQQFLQSSLASLRLRGDSIELVDVLYYSGVVAWLRGDYVVAHRHFLEELAMAERVGSEWDIALATGSLGLTAQALGEYEEAQQRFEVALAINRKLGEQRMEAVALHFLGVLKRKIGADEEAEACFRESLVLSGRVGERWTYAMALSELGAVMHALGEPIEGIRLLTESLTLLRELGEYWSILRALNSLGAASLATGAFAESHAAYHEALAVAWERQALPDALKALAGMARWWAQQGSPDKALTFVCFVLSHPAATKQLREGARQLQVELEKELEPDQFNATQLSAQEVTFEALVRRILESARV